MLTVGLTGNVASGKTTVADHWRAAGVAVVDADRLGHAALEEPAVRAALVEAFGPQVMAGGAVDREVLGRAAFAAPERTRRLDEIVHPPLLARLVAELERLEREGRDLAVVDAALVFEFGLDEDLDRVVLVTAPRGLREERLKERGLEADRIGGVMAAQEPDRDKVERSDYVIVNDGSLARLGEEADRVLDALKRDARDHDEGEDA